MYVYELTRLFVFARAAVIFSLKFIFSRILASERQGRSLITPLR